MLVHTIFRNRSLVLSAVTAACLMAMVPSHAQNTATTTKASNESGSKSIRSSQSRQIIINAEDRLNQLLFDSLMSFEGPGMDVMMVPVGGAGGKESLKNAPYSAEAVSETVRMLQDGNRIVNKQVTLLARDNAGRTRQQVQGASSVMLRDPEQNKLWRLDTRNQTAHEINLGRRLQLSKPGASDSAASGVSIQSQIITFDSTGVPNVQGLPPGQSSQNCTQTERGMTCVYTSRSTSKMGSSQSGTAASSVRMQLPPQVITLSGGQFPSLSMMTDGMGNANAQTTSLGTKTMEGVTVTGTMTTTTIPAGTVGNEKPIVITHERWVSSELNLVVYSKRDDPRSGQTIYRLQNLKTQPPAADQFEVPRDYKVITTGSLRDKLKDRLGGSMLGNMLSSFGIASLDADLLHNEE